MRHSDIQLTTKVHTDSGLFDLVTAVESLPMVHQTGVIGSQSESTEVNAGQPGRERKPRRNSLGSNKKPRFSRGFLRSWGSRIRT